LRALDLIFNILGLALAIGAFVAGLVMGKRQDRIVLIVGSISAAAIFGAIAAADYFERHALVNMIGEEISKVVQCKVVQVDGLTEEDIVLAIHSLYPNGNGPDEKVIIEALYSLVADRSIMVTDKSWSDDAVIHHTHLYYPRN
jgi:hypothetical protein